MHSSEPPVTVCCRCYKISKKASKKALEVQVEHPKDHLERSMRPIQQPKCDPWANLDQTKEARSLLDFISKFCDLKPIFH